jgi:nitrous oxidase accessory protein
LRKAFGAFAVLFLLVVALAPFRIKTARAGTITVPDDYPTIQAAINNANDGDTIFVRSGTYYEHVLVNKTVSLIGEDKDNTILNGTSIEPIMIVEANSARISSFRFEGWAFQDIVINATTGVTVIGNRISFNALGIDVENSVNATIENNIIDGFGLDNIGIMLAYSSECKIVNNTITNAVYDGIRLWFASSNLIHQNLLRTNDYGIFFHEANLNTISENVISESGGPGSYFESSSNNEILHNSFLNNYNHAKIFDRSINTWDNGFEGNYWSGYDGTDSDGDGVGDTPYIVDGSNQDNYPLMAPYMLGDINHDAIVDIFDVAKIAGIFGCSSIDPQYNPHCDVNEDGLIDIFDLVAIAVNFGKEWTPP